MSLGRLPGAVALPALTKVAPGVLAVWFVVLGEWRWLAWAAGTTAAIVLGSVLLAPEAWVRWVQFLGTSAGERGLGSTVRLVASLGLVVWAARRLQAWLLAPALILACPVLGGYGPLAVMAPVLRLRQWGRTDQSEPGRQTGDTRVVTS